MKNLLLGRSPITTVTGYLVAILTSVHQMSMSGGHSWQDFLLPAALALFGRFASDDNNNNPPPLSVLSRSRQKVREKQMKGASTVRKKRLAAYS